MTVFLRLLRSTLPVTALVLLASATPASAQVQAQVQDDDEPVIPVEIGLDLGDFDEASSDWPIANVEVSGELAEGETFTVELHGSSGPLWSGSAAFEAPVTLVAVDELVLVGSVVEANVSQVQPSVPAVVESETEVRPAEVLGGGSGAGGTGELALAMVLALVVVLLVFRTPLPSASTQRWRA